MLNCRENPKGEDALRNGWICMAIITDNSARLDEIVRLMSAAGYKGPCGDDEEAVYGILRDEKPYFMAAYKAAKKATR